MLREGRDARATEAVAAEHQRPEARVGQLLRHGTHVLGPEVAASEQKLLEHGGLQDRGEGLARAREVIAGEVEHPELRPRGRLREALHEAQAQAAVRKFQLVDLGRLRLQQRQQVLHACVADLRVVRDVDLLQRRTALFEDSRGEVPQPRLGQRGVVRQFQRLQARLVAIGLQGARELRGAGVVHAIPQHYDGRLAGLQP
mmetsp:Transcript_17788/g.56093  ORF Transcript_17788/g.56093 Transcript_17788/m.56093 type:complete len:200 (-) Transcript_17788:168-767(-)